MIFNTFSFAIFAAVAYAVYWLAVPARFRRQAIVVSGAIFYAFSVPAYLALIAALSLVTYGASAGLLAAKSKGAKDAILAAAVAAVVGCLAYFKYFHFLASTVDAVARHSIVPVPTIVVPLAISFFTFEFVHVLVDVRLGKIERVGFLDFLTFAFFFPTLVAGPIKRYETFVVQLDRLQPPSRAQTIDNLYRIAIGLFKKIVLADSFSVFTAAVTAPGPPYHRADYVLAALAYAGKIYFDFSAYSDIAIGLGALLGLRIPENFDKPYHSRNIQEFWRRWHISLSSWIRDYLFIPLGGSRRPAVVVGLNLLLVMAIAGLWHGASWTFVLWGLYHGAGLAVHRVWTRSVVARVAFLRRPSRALSYASLAATFAFVVFGWVLFAAATLPDAGFVYRELLFFPGTNPT